MQVFKTHSITLLVHQLLQGSLTWVIYLHLIRSLAMCCTSTMTHHLQLVATWVAAVSPHWLASYASLSSANGSQFYCECCSIWCYCHRLTGKAAFCGEILGRQGHWVTLGLGRDTRLHDEELAKYIQKRVEAMTGLSLDAYRR